MPFSDFNYFSQNLHCKRPGFLVEVPDRRARTLEALILQYILPGSSQTDGQRMPTLPTSTTESTLTPLLCIKQTSWIPTTRTLIRRMWRTCGCGPKESCGGSSGPPELSFLHICTSLSTETASADKNCSACSCLR